MKNKNTSKDYLSFYYLIPSIPFDKKKLNLEEQIRLNYIIY